MCGEALPFEEGDEIIWCVVDIWKFACWCGASGIFAANPGANARALGTGDGGVVVSVLSEVGIADFELRLDFAEEKTDGLQAVVLRAVDLAEVHHEGPVCATGRGIFVPGTGIVEAEADRGTGIVIALTIFLFELLCKLSGDIVPCTFVRIR